MVPSPMLLPPLRILFIFFSQSLVHIADGTPASKMNCLQRGAPFSETAVKRRVGGGTTRTGRRRTELMWQMLMFALTWEQTGINTRLQSSLGCWEVRYRRF